MRVADMHCDTISRLYEQRRTGKAENLKENSGHLDLKRMKQGDYIIQNFAMFTSLKAEPNPYDYCNHLIDLFYSEIEKNQSLIQVAKKYKDIVRNQKEGRISALLTIEEGGVCLGNLDILKEFYEKGVRMMTLTWNYKNELAFPNDIERDGTAVPNTKDGLTKTGFDFIHAMEEMGMIIDISHLGDAGIRDVFSHTKKPVVASHSNARGLASHPRNLPDDMIRELSEKGGVMGINYCAAFLKDYRGKEEPRISRVADMVSHMKYIKNIGGIQCIGLGSDYDGIDCDLEMKSPADISMLEHEMKKAGFTSNEVDAVFYKNVLRIYEELLM